MNGEDPRRFLRAGTKGQDRGFRFAACLRDAGRGGDL
ncbi:MAG: hypothetical protein A4E73_03527 [Syntrophaceae bacterium PtaU1.Bin231]|nr:MAG: hypothetical protein A4E73_03527 [Syntrophaceae bacterium PtaU1.Bin231]